MYDPAVLRFALLSGLIGFSAFCISYAFLVWRRRNAAASGSAPSRAERSRRWAVCLLITGGIAVGIAVAVSELNRPAGVLSGDGLYAIRSPSDHFRLTYLVDAGTVSEGDVVARLESPEAVAKVQELELECRRLEKQRGTLLLDSLDLDPELVRRHQNAITIGNQLQASIDQLLPANESVIRQAALERLARLEKRAQIEIDIAWYQGELKLAFHDQTYVARDLGRVNRLIEQDAVTESEVDSRRKQAEELNLKTANLQRRIDGLKREEAQIDRSLQEIAALLESQRETLGTELNRARTDRTKAAAETQGLASQLEADLQRAKEFRRREIEQLDLKLEQCRAQLAGAEQTLVILAPYDGTVVYRDPSPRSAEEKQPLFVLARQPGFRLQARLPRAQVAALGRAGEVTIELADPFVEPYFAGRFLEARPMPCKPRYVVAELACKPPEEAIRKLLEGETIVAKLQWRPPLTTLLPFQVGAVLLLAGTAGWMVSFVKPSHRNTGKRPPGQNGHDLPTFVSRISGVANERTRSFQLPLRRTGDLEAGPVAALHELLG